MLKQTIIKASATIALLLLILISLFIAYLRLTSNPRNAETVSWVTGNETTREALSITAVNRCFDAPFILPADGYIGLLYEDPRGPYSTSRPHQGIDIFSPDEPGITPVYAAYDGYITREENWRSTLIQRVPQDPLQPDRQIWLYYTHMALHGTEIEYIDPLFPPGTRDQFVSQGTLLGYTGNYNGSALRAVGTHLHFSIVLDNGAGNYLNELEFTNTIDPTPYLSIPVLYSCATAGPPVCSENPVCSP